MAAWEDEVGKRFNNAAAIQVAVKRAAASMMAPPSRLLHASLVSFADLECGRRSCGSSLAGATWQPPSNDGLPGRSADHKSECSGSCRLLLGWLSCVGDDNTNIAGPSRKNKSSDIGRDAPDAGVLQLTDSDGTSLRCSVRAEDAPAPQLFGRLVLAPSWRFVAATPSLAYGASHLELNGPLVDCLGGSALPRERAPRRAYGDGPTRPLSAVPNLMAKHLASERTTPSRKRARGDVSRRALPRDPHAVLLHVAGEVRAISELARLGTWRHCGREGHDRSIVGAPAVDEPEIAGTPGPKRGSACSVRDGDARKGHTSHYYGAGATAAVGSSPPAASPVGGLAGADDAFFLLELFSRAGSEEAEGPHQHTAAAASPSGNSAPQCTRVWLVFGGRQAIRWRAFLRVEQSFLISNVQPCKVRGEWRALRSTQRTALWLMDDAGRVKEVGAAPDPALQPGERRRCGRWRAGASPTQPSPLAQHGCRRQVLKRRELLSQSQHWGFPASQLLLPGATASAHPPALSPTSPPTQHGTMEEAKAVQPVTSSTLITYEGTVTRRISASAFEIDDSWLLLTSHAPLQPHLGMRAGAKVRLVDVHPLHAPMLPDVDGRMNGTGRVRAVEGGAGADCPDVGCNGTADNGWELVGFGLCGRGHVELLAHAAPSIVGVEEREQGAGRRCGIVGSSSSPLSPHLQSSTPRADCESRLLATRLNLAELASLHRNLLPTWHARWRGMLAPSERHALLLTLLDVSGLKPLRPEPAATRQGRSIDSDECSGRFFAQFCAHAAGGCRLCEARAPLPFAPPLASVLCSRPVVKLLARSVHLERQQLLPSECAASAWQPQLVLLGEIALASPPSPPGLVLRDATGEVRLLLPPNEMAMASLRLGSIYAISSFELLAQPDLPPPPPPPLSATPGSKPAPCATLFVRCPLGVMGAGAGSATSLLSEVAGMLLLPRMNRPPPCVACAWERNSTVNGVNVVGSQSVPPVLVRPVRMPLGSASPSQHTLEALVCLVPKREPAISPPFGPSTTPQEEWRGTSFETMTLILRHPAHAHVPLLQLGCEYAVHGGCKLGCGAGGATELVLASPSIRIEFIRSAPDWGGVPRAWSLLQLHTRCPSSGHEGGQGVDVVCVLREATWKKGTSVELALTSEDGAQRVEAWVNPSDVRLPAGLLPGTRLRLSNALATRSLGGNGKLYLRLISTSGINVCFQPHAGPAQPCTESPMEEDRLSTIEQLSLRAYVRPAVRLRVTVLRLRQMSFQWRCHGCGQVQHALSCGCTSAGLPGGAAASFEELCLADVADGSGKAMLEVPGRLVWALLQSSDSVVGEVATIARRAGPLTVTMDNQTKDCLTLGDGDWKCSPNARLEPVERLALAAAIPSSMSWQRNFVSVCRRTSLVSNDLETSKEVRVGGQQYNLSVMHGCPRLQALHIEACSARLELERELVKAAL